MSRMKVRDIKKQALTLLKEHKPDYRKIVFQSVGIAALYSVFVSVVSLILSGYTDNSQGLSGMGTAAILLTAQMFLSLAGNLLMPFGSIGMLYTSVRVARRQNTEFSMLTRGFQRFGPVLRYFLLYGMILIALAFMAVHIVVLFSVCIPIPPALQAALVSLEQMTDPNEIVTFMAQLPPDQLMLYYTPMYILVFSAAFLIVNYRICMARYLLLDETKIGAFASLHISSQMTKGDRCNLFKLNLSFWWYTLGLALITSIPFIPDVLVLFRVQLPISDSLTGLIFGCISLLLELVWMVAAGTYNQIAWACAYEALRVPPQQPETEEQTA